MLFYKKNNDVTEACVEPNKKDKKNFPFSCERYFHPIGNSVEKLKEKEAERRKEKEHDQFLQRKQVKMKSYFSRGGVYFRDRGVEFESPETTIGEGVFIHGEVTFKRLLQVDGHFEGTFKTNGKIVVGTLGVVKSENMEFESAWIEGKVEGNLQIKGVLILTETSVVMGDIEADSLIVHEGASIEGKVTVTNKNNKQLQNEETQGQEEKIISALHEENVSYGSSKG